MSEARYVLGIDAAWTPREPSGVALLALPPSGQARCLAVAPSYEAFCTIADGADLDFAAGRFVGSEPDPARLLNAAAKVTGGDGKVDVVAVDMPMSRQQISGRRACDNEVSRAFGKQKCGTHSPNAERPGTTGQALADGFVDAGFLLATTADRPRTPEALIEVYPHPAILSLVGADERVPYKVGKSRRYWPDVASKAERIGRLLQHMQCILDALKARIANIDLQLPRPRDVCSIASLKRYEDAIDALVCAWVGVAYLQGKATAYGDEDAAIWIPRRVGR